MKRYMKPSTEVLNVMLEGQLMTMSGNAGDATINGGYNGEYESGTVNLGSRRGSVWGDEEEDF